LLEIELKAALDARMAEGLEKRLAGLGFYFDGMALEKDIYYSAPDRDFLARDEALRIRELSSDGKQETWVTYKGPKEDPLSNTRLELESPVGDGKKMAEIFTALGYQPILDVSKSRRHYKGQRNFGEITLCLDRVEGLGSFIELEVVAPGSVTHKEREGIRDGLLSLLDQLGISRSSLTRESYLELLIKAARS